MKSKLEIDKRKTRGREESSRSNDRYSKYDRDENYESSHKSRRDRSNSKHNDRYGSGSKRYDRYSSNRCSRRSRSPYSRRNQRSPRSRSNHREKEYPSKSYRDGYYDQKKYSPSKSNSSEK